jgi:hypothetical protein
MRLQTKDEKKRVKDKKRHPTNESATMCAQSSLLLLPKRGRQQRKWGKATQ